MLNQVPMRLPVDRVARDMLLERQAKISKLLTRLDATADGDVSVNELRAILHSILFDGGDGPEDADEQVETAVRVFHDPSADTINVTALRHALLSSHQLLEQQLNSQPDSSGGSRSDFLANTGTKLIGDGDVSSDVDLREEIRTILCRHAARTMEIFGGLGNRILSRAEFCQKMSDLLGLGPEVVGEAAAQSLQGAVEHLYRSWDLASIGLTVNEINRILHKGGRIIVAQRVKPDSIFQIEIASAPIRIHKSAHKDRATLISEAKQSFHGFVLQSREEQLQTRRLGAVRRETSQRLPTFLLMNGTSS